MDIDDFIDDFTKRLDQMERATGEPLGTRLKIIWLLDTCRVRNLVWIDITDVMMTKPETDWWDLTISRLRSHYRSYIEKERKGHEEEEVHAAMNYYARARGRGQQVRGRGFFRGRGGPPPTGRGNGNQQGSEKPGEKLNPISKFYGVRMRCFYCNSETHLARNCRKGKQKGLYLAEEEEHVANFIGTISSESSHEDSLMAWQTKEELGEFTQEAYGKAILDTGCTSTVAGRKWLEHYKKMLPAEHKYLLKGPYYTKSIFRCANNIPMKSEG